MHCEDLTYTTELTSPEHIIFTTEFGNSHSHGDEVNHKDQTKTKLILSQCNKLQIVNIFDCLHTNRNVWTQKVSMTILQMRASFKEV